MGKPIKTSDLGREVQRDLDAVCRSSGNRLWEVFRDCMECCAIALSNGCDPSQREAREAVYMKHVERYGKEAMGHFSHALAQIAMAMEAEPCDLMGQLFMALEFGDANRGQFFTPYDLSRVIAGMSIDPESLERTIEERGYITLSEPACGSGGMIVAFADEMRRAGFNPQQQLHVTAVDVDTTAVHMAYIQVSLMGIPAIIIQGNTLTLETRSVWRTPFHIIFGWEQRLKLRAETPSETTTEEPHEKDLHRHLQTSLFDSALAGKDSQGGR